MTETQIRLLALYTFGNTQSTEDLSGIWETVAVRGLDSGKVTWELIRRYSVAVESPVGAKISLPDFAMNLFAKRIDRIALQGEI